MSARLYCVEYVSACICISVTNLFQRRILLYSPSRQITFYIQYLRLQDSKYIYIYIYMHAHTHTHTHTHTHMHIYVREDYTIMLRAVLNKSWKQYLTKERLKSHLPPISQTLQVRRRKLRDTAEELTREVL